jgi:hypothetical protein
MARLILWRGTLGADWLTSRCCLRARDDSPFAVGPSGWVAGNQLRSCRFVCSNRLPLLREFGPLSVEKDEQ